jgi:pimeloyl-ACP methyl ester carboxylesterase
MGAGREAVTEVLSVGVPGGALAVEHVTAGTGRRGPVLAVHGISSHLGLDRVPVCGMSMGGFVAVELATAYPDRVTSLVLVDGGFPCLPHPA